MTAVRCVKPAREIAACPGAAQVEAELRELIGQLEQHPAVDVLALNESVAAALVAR